MGNLAVVETAQERVKDYKATPIKADLEKASDELQGVLTSPQVMVDPARRKEAAPKLIPIVKRMISSLGEAAQAAAQNEGEVRLEAQDAGLQKADDILNLLYYRRILHCAGLIQIRPSINFGFPKASDPISMESSRILRAASPVLASLA